jgi:hypothetical protein
MNRSIIKNIFKNYLITESILGDDEVYSEEIEDIEDLDKTEKNFESKLDKIWNTLELKFKKNNSDISKLNSSVNDLLSDYVNYLSQKGENPTVWLRRKKICDLWKD